MSARVNGRLRAVGGGLCFAGWGRHVRGDCGRGTDIATCFRLSRKLACFGLLAARFAASSSGVAFRCRGVLMPWSPRPPRDRPRCGRRSDEHAGAAIARCSNRGVISGAVAVDAAGLKQDGRFVKFGGLCPDCKPRRPARRRLSPLRNSAHRSVRPRCRSCSAPGCGDPRRPSSSSRRSPGFCLSPC